MSWVKLGCSIEKVEWTKDRKWRGKSMERIYHVCVGIQCCPEKALDYPPLRCANCVLTAHTSNEDRYLVYDRALIISQAHSADQKYISTMQGSTDDSLVE